MTKTNNKNIVFLHLESISNEIFFNNKHNLIHLGKLCLNSVYFNKFYTSATSSAMALIDFLYGNDFETDRFTCFDDVYLDKTYNKNLFQILQDNEYAVMGIGYNKRIATEEVNKLNTWAVEGNKYIWEDSYPQFINKIDTFIHNNKSNRFALHIWNLITHVGHMDEYTDTFQTFSERMDVSYKLLDNTIETLMKCLKSNNLLENTIIVAYGDHGDDKWTRGINSGCTHIIEPYLNVIGTPAFIYDSRSNPKMMNELVSLIDLKNTALSLLDIEEDVCFPHSGINIFNNENKYIFAQNLFANQKTEEIIKSPEMIKLNNNSNTDKKNKSFCVIDNKYSLLVSNYGLELFMHSIDPFGYNNLLTFFDFDSSGNIIGFNNRGAWKGHFRGIMMVEAQIDEIKCAYNKLRIVLMDRIKAKNQLVTNNAKYLFDMSNFNKVKPREYIW